MDLRGYVRIAAAFALVLSFAVPAISQTAAPAPAEQTPGSFPHQGKINQQPGESREAFLQRLGLVVDPGADPDSQKEFVRWGKRYRIDKYKKSQANYKQLDRPGWIRPHGWVNIYREAYQDNDEWVWVFEEVKEKKPAGEEAAAAPSPSRNPKMTPEKQEETRKFLSVVKQDFSALTPEESAVVLRFTDGSKGLPPQGSWRNSSSVADMNGDGKADLVVPPQRAAGSNVPTIYLGDGKGNWKEWEKASFPIGVNYGAVVAADVNSDKHQDLVIGAHLSGVYVFLGDGKGYFKDGSPKSEFATRRVAVEDIDGDKDLDIIAISEGPGRSSGPSAQPSLNKSNVRAYLNDGKAKWTEIDVAQAGYSVAGDWLEVADFNGDKRLDVVGSSIYYNAPDLFYLGTQEKQKWAPFGRAWLPFASYYGALTTGKFTSTKADDAILSFVRHWPKRVSESIIEAPPLDAVSGIERVSWTAEGPQRNSIIRWEGARGILGMGSGDFDGDGKLDVVYSIAQPREYGFLLGDGKGGFKRAKVEGIDLPSHTVYDINTADVNGDKRADLILLYEAQEGKQDGSVRVYLNAGVAK